MLDRRTPRIKDFDGIKLLILGMAGEVHKAHAATPDLSEDGVFSCQQKAGKQVVLVDGLAFSLAGDDVFDFGGYDLRLEGLFDVVFGTLGVGFEDAFFVADGGQKEDGDIFPKVALEEALMEMEAVFARHHHVKKDDIDGVAVEQGNRFVSVLCAKDRHTVLMESQL